MKRECLVIMLLAFEIAVQPASSSHAQEARETSGEVTVSTAHSLFGKQCNLCHEPFAGPSEKLCLGCHPGPPHNAAQSFTPPCVACHVEHRGQAQLARVDNGQCATCHQDVKTKEGVPLTIERSVTDFARRHPEFAFALRNSATPERVRLDQADARQSDRSKIVFPHATHLRPKLKSPKGEVQLVCRNCHTPAANGLQMEPVTYLARCQECHRSDLAFDPTYADRVVPHASPESVRAYLYLTYTERRGGTPSPSPSPGRITRPVPSVSPINPASSVAQRVAEAERLLYTQKKCDKCHIVQRSGQALPEIGQPAIPSLWFPDARFAHHAHRMLECVACHVDATKSKKAADVLLPGIQLCRECHRADTQEGPIAQQRNTATIQCISCHFYHDNTIDAEWNGRFTVPQILTEGLPRQTRSQPASGGAHQ